MKNFGRWQRRSILTGEPDKVTIQMSAPRTLTTGDVMFAVGKLGRAAGFEPMVGKISVAKDPKIAVFDMSAKAAKQLVDFSSEQNLESISFELCSTLPTLQSVEGSVSFFFVVLCDRGLLALFFLVYLGQRVVSNE